MSPLEGNIDAVKVEFLDWEEQTEEQRQISIQVQRFRWALLEWMEHEELSPPPVPLRQFSLHPNPTRMVVMPS